MFSGPAWVFICFCILILITRLCWFCFFFFFFFFTRSLSTGFQPFFLTYLLFLPFDKGKSLSFILIPGQILGAEESYKFWFNIAFSDLAFMVILGLILKKEIMNRWRVKKLSFEKKDVFLFGFLLFSFVSVFFSHFQLVSFLAFLRLVRLAAVFYLIQKVSKHNKLINLTPLVLSASLIFQGPRERLAVFY